MLLKATSDSTWFCLRWRQKKKKKKKKQKKKIKGKNPNSIEAYRAIDHGIGTTSIFLEKQYNMKYKIQKLSPFFSSVSWQLNKV